VYAWGNNNLGQIGNGNLTFNSVPKQVNHELNKKNVIRIACGPTFNIVMTDENKLYGWGNNVCGQISTDNTSLSFITSDSGSTSNFTNSMFSQYKSNSRNSVFDYKATSYSVQSPTYYLYPREITAISDKIGKFLF